MMTPKLKSPWLMVLAAATMWLLLAVAAPVAHAQLTDADVAKIPQGDQPLPFSHKIHAGDNKIDCQYCHIYARRSWVAGAPPVRVCMGCHTTVATDLQVIQKLTKYWEDKTPIPWRKIHDVPDFVRFPHFKHVNAKNETFPAGVSCQQCHGPVQDMEVVQVANPEFGTMGWCLSCHLTVPGTVERKKATPDEKDPKAVANMTNPMRNNIHRPLLTDCWTCHK